MSIALNVVEIACQQAVGAGADKVESITLEIGDLAGVMLDSLEFCFPSACKGTIAAEAVLKVDRVAGEGHCLECDAHFPVESFITICPECEQYRVEILHGRELRVKSIMVND